MDYTRLSREVSYALRHAPHEYGLELDDEGFVPIERLLDAINRRSDYGRPITADDLQEVIRASDKRRHEMVGGMIRALYGHSTPEKIVRQPVLPPAVLYHGTARRFLGSILESGLKPMGRQYVHLSADAATARQVGSRHDAKPVILLVDAESAYERGVRFYPGKREGLARRRGSRPLSQNPRVGACLRYERNPVHAKRGMGHAIPSKSVYQNAYQMCTKRKQLRDDASELRVYGGR